MKTHRTLQIFGAALLAVVNLHLGTVSSRGAEEIFISQFNDAGGLAGWRFDYGGVTNLFEFDASQDSSNNPASGSLKVTFGFDAASLSGSGNNKGALTIDLGTPIDASTFVTMEMDIKIETGSAADGAGNSGFFQMVIRNTGSYQFNSQFGGNVSSNAGWRHISVAPTGSREDIRAITLEIFGGTALTGPVTFHVDNIKFTKPIVTTDVVVDRFDDGLLAAFWRFDYGGVTSLLQFDPTQDAAGNPASGSLKTTLGFNADFDTNGNNKGAITLDLPSPLAGAAYLTMEMDVKVEPGSAADGSGNSGFFQMVIRNTITYEFISQGGVNVSSNGGWRHVVANLTGAHDDIYAITLELYGGAALTGPVTFYIDNLKFTAPGGGPPPPTLFVERPLRGLNLTPTSGQFQRQNIATVANNFGWIGRPDPITYSLAIGKYPDASHAGFQTHIFLVPGNPGTDSAPDYSQPHIVFLDIQRQASGGAFASLHYKVNEPAGNNFLYGQGTLGGVGSAIAEGTWTLTLSQDTNVTVTAPDSTSGTFVIPPADAALFAGAITVYIGDQPNSGGNVGQTAIFNSFRITSGGQTLLEDNFLTADILNSTLWRVAAGDAAGVQLVAPDAIFWLGWSLPDSGFSLQASGNLADPNSWLDPGLTVPVAGAARRVLIHAFTETPVAGKVYAPSASHAFFRLSKPQ